MTASGSHTDDPRTDMLPHPASSRAFALSLTRHRASAADLVQGTIDKFTPDTNPKAWLFDILLKHRRAVADAHGIHALTLSVKPDHDGWLAFRDFQRTIDLLTPEHREGLIRANASGFTCEQAAQVTDLAVDKAAWSSFDDTAPTRAVRPPGLGAP